MNRVSLSASCAVLMSMVLLLLNPGCSPETVSGGGTEGGNTVCGVLINSDKSTSIGAKVYLLPADFNGGTDDLTAAARVTTTEDDGRYVFDKTAEGNYTIQAEDAENGNRTLITGIKVSGKDIEIPVPVDTLRKPGVMVIEIPETNDNVSGYLYVPGTTIHTSITDTSKFVVIKDIPAKKLPPICLAHRTDPTPDVLRYNVEINSSDTVVVRNTQWEYCRRLYLNTTQTGAGVNETVTGFPVVIRLTESNFDFSQTHTDGGDVQFIRADSVPLFHEIERWDIFAGQGEIWVSVDTIYGNDSTQFITMYWSNPDTSDHLKNTSVFDTSLGFQGVWHLDENTDTIYDATPNRFHGVRNGAITASSGMVGYGQMFQDSGASIDMGNVLNTETSDLTVSAWVKRSATGLQTIMAKSDGGDPSSEYGWTLSFHNADQLHFFAASGGADWGDDGVFDCWSNEEAPVIDTASWHYVVAVFDRSDKKECRLYIDGVELTGGVNGNIDGVNTLTNEVPFRIGAEADGDYSWTGSIDECVVAHTIRSATWIRMCYSNQGQDDLLVQYE